MPPGCLGTRLLLTAEAHLFPESLKAVSLAVASLGQVEYLIFLLNNLGILRQGLTVSSGLLSNLQLALAQPSKCSDDRHVFLCFRISLQLFLHK